MTATLGVDERFHVTVGVGEGVSVSARASARHTASATEVLMPLTMDDMICDVFCFVFVICFLYKKKITWMRKLYQNDFPFSLERLVDGM